MATPFISSLTHIGRQLTTFQWVTLGFLVAMTITGLIMSGRGEPMPSPFVYGFCSAIVVVLFGAFQSLGLMKSADEKTRSQAWDVSADRKKRKLDKKKELQKKRDQELEEEARVRQEAKAAILREKAALKAAEKSAVEAAKAVKAEAAAKAPTPTKHKKKKKKKAAKKAVVEETPADTPEDPGWEVQHGWQSLRAAKKQMRGAGEVYKTEMDVPRRYHSQIIGIKGQTKSAIEKAANVSITMPGRDSTDDFVIIEGTEECVQVTRKAIEEIMEMGFCRILYADKVTMEIKNMALLMGPGGSYIEAIRRKSGCKIDCPPKKSELKEITLMGEPEAIAMAVESVKQLLAQGYSDMTHEDYTAVSISFSGSFLLALLRTRDKMKEIEKATETQIKMESLKNFKNTPENKNEMFNLTITGPRVGVEQAKLKLTNVHKDFTTAEIDYPVDMLLLLKGPGGKKIQQLEKDTNTRINIIEHLWDVTHKSVAITGFKNEVHKVSDAITDILESNKRVTITFPKERIGTLIGKGGQVIKDLQAKTKTHVSTGDHEWDDTVSNVTIEGLKENVEAAIEVIHKLRARPERKVREKEEVIPPEASQTLQFPNSRAGVLIGRRGANIQQLEESTKTKIRVSDMEDGSHKRVVIEGSAEAVALAVEKIEELKTSKPRKASTKTETQAPTNDDKPDAKDAA